MNSELNLNKENAPISQEQHRNIQRSFGQEVS